MLMGDHVEPRRKSLETYANRLRELEDIANSYSGVEKSFAVQAGREVRIMVIPEQVSEDEMTIMAHDIAKQIQDQMQYPGDSRRRNATTAASHCV